MKKILVLILPLLLLTGCDDKVTTVTDANGDSKTYQFFINEDYKVEEYTLKLKNDDTKITIVQSDSKNYYESVSKSTKTKVIEKEGNKYTINPNGKTYTTEPIVSLDNYASGYLPLDMENLKTKGYKTGKEKIGWTKYVFEEYTYQGVITTYYFKGDKLKFIKKQSPLTEETVEFVSVNSKIDEEVFELPKGYQEITY